LLILTLIMLPIQFKTLRSKQHSLYEQNLAAVALEMGVHDKNKISTVYPNSDHALSIAEEASKHNRSVFGSPWLKDVRKRIGQKYLEATDSLPKCQGAVENIENVAGEKSYYKIQGWSFTQNNIKSPHSLWILGPEGIITGYAIFSPSQKHTIENMQNSGFKSKFKGYVLSNLHSQTITIVDPLSQCAFIAAYTTPLFQLEEGISENLAKKVTVLSSQIMEGNQWVGKDYQGTAFKHLSVVGSFIQSDADTGKITIRMNRGDRLLYRSGPSTKNQFITVNLGGNKVIKNNLPISLNWQILDFSHPILTPQFSITFNDEGTNWGEWSAIAVLK